ncbi:MAG: MarR family transcriptional regulator [Burkholderiaceae bacterium]
MIPKTGELTHGQYLPYLLNRVVSQINAPMQRALRRRGMTMTHWRVLGFLVERDGLIISELADRTVTDQATLSRALDRLEARQLVRREPCLVDSRQIRIHLCEAGRREYHRLRRIATEIEDWAFRDMDPQRLAALHASLMELSAALSERPCAMDEPQSRAA